jgi:hypothetical protein
MLRGPCTARLPRVDHPCLAEHRLARCLLEARLVDQRRDLVLVRQLERRVVLVRPGDRQFERAAGVETGRPRIPRRPDLRPPRRLEHLRPLGPKEGEVAHEPTSSGVPERPYVCVPLIWLVMEAHMSGWQWNVVWLATPTSPPRPPQPRSLDGYLSG